MLQYINYYYAITKWIMIELNLLTGAKGYLGTRQLISLSKIGFKVGHFGF